MRCALYAVLGSQRLFAGFADDLRRTQESP
jgi:hypothetical protein